MKILSFIVSTLLRKLDFQGTYRYIFTFSFITSWNTIAKVQLNEQRWKMLHVFCHVLHNFVIQYFTPLFYILMYLFYPSLHLAILLRKIQFLRVYGLIGSLPYKLVFT